MRDTYWFIKICAAMLRVMFLPFEVVIRAVARPGHRKRGHRPVPMRQARPARASAYRRPRHYPPPLARPVAYRFNPPPTWPAPPLGFNPQPGWQPDPRWGPPPPGWQVWIPS